MSYFSMSKLALKWALRKPPTSRYPFEPRKTLPGSRGALVFNEATCVYCGVCVKKCPTGALTVTRAEKLWAIDRLRCVNCNSCVEICPKQSLHLSTGHPAPQTAKARETYKRTET